MTDKEKIEVASKKITNEKYGLDGAGLVGFEEGVAWRDKNPGPHVMAMVGAAMSIENSLRFPVPNRSKTQMANFIQAAIAQFEQAVKGE